MCSKKIKKIDIIPIAIFVVCFLTCVFLNIKYTRSVLDSDMASEMVLANLLNKEGSFISRNFYYGNEIRVFHLKSLYRVFLLLFPNNWIAARIASQCVSMLLLALSVFLFLKVSEISMKGIYVASILMLPISFWYAFHGVFGGFYIIFIIQDFILLSLVLFVSKCLKIQNTILLVVVSFLIGMNGMKSFIYFAIPNSIAICFIIISNFLDKKTDLYSPVFDSSN